MKSNIWKLVLTEENRKVFENDSDLMSITELEGGILVINKCIHVCAKVPNFTNYKEASKYVDDNELWGEV